MNRIVSVRVSLFVLDCKVVKFKSTHANAIFRRVTVRRRRNRSGIMCKPVKSLSSLISSYLSFSQSKIYQLFRGRKRGPSTARGGNLSGTFLSKNVWAEKMRRDMYNKKNAAIGRSTLFPVLDSFIKPFLFTRTRPEG